jgi:sugar-specific transcriptional regulator TrmB
VNEQELARALSELGLTASQSRVYLALLSLGEERATRIAAHAGVSRTKIYELLQSLESYGFCRSEGHHGMVYRPVAPQVAIPQWLDGRERRRRLEAARDQELAAALVRELPAPPPFADGEDGAFEAVVGRTRTSAVLPRLGRRARRSLDVMQMPPFVQPRSAWNVVEAEAVGRGVRVRILNNAEGLKEVARVKEALRVGAEVRAAAAVPIKMIIRDGEEAAIGLSDAAPGSAGVTSVIFRHADLVGGLQRLFEEEWERAREVTVDERGELAVASA